MARVYVKLTAVALFVAGCGQNAEQGAVPASTVHLKVYQAKYVLAEEPASAVGVLTAREAAKNNEEIVVVGRIGGSATPWIEGRAAFVLADASVLTEATGDCEEGCTEPCCAQLKELAGFTALVKFVDEQGQTPAADARELFGVSERDMVVVRGRAQRDEEGNLTILANGIYVRR